MLTMLTIYAIIVLIHIFFITLIRRMLPNYDMMVNLHSQFTTACVGVYIVNRTFLVV